MPNLNLFELETCLKDLAKHAAKYPRKPYTAKLAEEASKALEEFYEEERTTDRLYTEWRFGIARNMSSSKKLSLLYKTIQGKLAKLGVLFDGQNEHLARRIGYFKDDELERYAADLLRFLEQNRHQIDFADKAIQDLRQNLETGDEHTAQQDSSRRTFRRQAVGRKLAIDNAAATIGAWRDTLRHTYGTEHPDYKAVRWPTSVRPD